MTAHLIAMVLTSLAGGGLVLAACGEVKPSMSASENEFQKPGRTADISAGRGGAAVRFNWQMNCQGCHHPNGEGNAARGIPPLEKLELFQRIPEGREFLIRVPGMSRSALSDEDLTELANWMITEFASQKATVEWRRYSVDEVAGLRSRPIVDGVVEYRADLMRKLERAGVGPKKSERGGLL